jgi:hypothetical protein
MMVERDTAVRSALTQIGAALSSGDPNAVAALWDVPGLVLADQGGRAIATRGEVRDFFSGAIRWYREQGTPMAIPELEDIAWITERIAAVRVDWIGADAEGNAVNRESSFYLMRLGEDGIARIQVALPRTEGVAETR